MSKLFSRSGSLGVALVTTCSGGVLNILPHAQQFTGPPLMISQSWVSIPHIEQRFLLPTGPLMGLLLYVPMLFPFLISALDGFGEVGGI